jgi:hypothetical protein
MSDDVRDRIAELRESMAGLEAPGSVKTNVIAAFGEAEPRRRASWYGWAAVAAAAVVVLAAILWWPQKRNPERATVVLPKPEATAPTAVTAPPPAPQAPVLAVKSQRRKPARAPKPVPVRAPRRELATDFFAFPYAPPIDVAEEAQIVRVRLPRSAMRSVGLPVNEDRWFESVPADVLLGQDGVARAVRFVKVAQ